MFGQTAFLWMVAAAFGSFMLTLGTVLIWSKPWTVKLSQE